MPASSVAVRSLALALLGFGSASALAQNVSAFNPYNGIGLPGSPAPMMPQAGAGGAPAQAGMAFNPWRPAGVAAGWGAPPPPPAYAAYQGGGYQGGGYGGGYDRGSYLPAPPPGPLESRIVAIPERGERGGARRAPTSITPAPAPQPQAALVPSPPVTTPAPAAPSAAPPAIVVPNTAPAPVPVQRPPVAAAPAPTPAPAPAPTPAEPPPAQTAAVAPPPTPPAPPAVRPPPPAGAAMATLQFSRDSAEISGESRGELERVAKSIGNTRQIEVRAYATGSDPADARKVALARALAVRSYLIDQGVKARIEVGAFASETRGAGNDRVDILTP